MEKELAEKQKKELDNKPSDKFIYNKNLDLYELSDVTETWKTWRSNFKEIVDGVTEKREYTFD